MHPIVFSAPWSTICWLSGLGSPGLWPTQILPLPSAGPWAGTLVLALFGGTGAAFSSGGPNDGGFHLLAAAAPAAGNAAAGNAAAGNVAAAGNAAAGNAAASGNSGWLLFMAASVFLFYFLVLAPEKKRKAEEEKKRSSFKKNDRVVTVGGIHGSIAAVSPDDDVITIKVDGNTRLKINRSAIAQVITETNDDSKSKPAADDSGGS